MMNASQTFQDLLAEFSDEIFVGRTAQLALFEQLFTAVRPPFLILAVSGQGGVGKTTLLEQFRHTADQYKAYSALVNEDHKTIIDVLASFVEQLRHGGQHCKTFNERYHKYRELKEQVEADPKAPKGFLDFAVRGATRIGLRTLRRVPVAGDVADVLLSAEAEDHLVEESSAFATYIAQKFTNKDERVLLIDSEKELTGYFLTDITKLAADQRVILFFDTYEQTAPYLDSWLRDLINGKYGAFSSRVSLVIAGRYPLGQPWTRYSRAIRQVELDPFTEEEAQEYLLHSGITDEAQIVQFLKLSDRLPVLLALLTFAPGDVPTDLSADAVERFLQGMTNEEREIALRAAIPRYFNRDILSILISSEQAEYAFTWLSAAHFVRQGEEGWRYHDVVRTLLLRYFRLRSNAQYGEMHEKVANYYTTQLALTEEQRRTNRLWRRLETERLYHIVASQPAHNLIELINSLLQSTLAELEEGVAEAEIRINIKQTAQLILQIYHESGDASLALWAKNIERLATTEDNLAAFTQAANSTFSVLLTLPSLNVLSKHTIWLLAATLHGEKKAQNEALYAITQAIQICPDRPYSYTKRAVIYRTLKKYTEATGDYTKAIDLQPHNGNNYYWRGITYFTMKEYAAALADLTKAIDLQPDDSNNYLWRGITYSEMKEYAAALADLTKAIDLQPDNGNNYYLRGITYSEMKEYAAALADLTKAIDLQPDDSYNYRRRGRIHSEMKEYAAALADLTKAIDLQPHNGNNYYWRGITYSEMKEYAAALADLTKAIDLQPHNGNNYYWRGITYSEMKEYAAALTDLTKAIDLQPDDGYNYRRRGITYSEMKEYTAALADLTKAIDLQPDNGSNYHWQGRILFEMGDYANALAAFIKAIELEPDNTENHYWQEQIYKATTHYAANDKAE